jgi:hypothetical protein
MQAGRMPLSAWRASPHQTPGCRHRTRCPARIVNRLYPV